MITCYRSSLVNAYLQPNADNERLHTCSHTSASNHGRFGNEGKSGADPRALRRNAKAFEKKAGGFFFMGNGGSAADCQHLAAEFMGRFQADRAPLPAIALTTNSSNITAIGNDFGFQYVFARQVAAPCDADDVVFAISTSGKSPNGIEGVQEVRKKKSLTIRIAGKLPAGACKIGSRDMPGVDRSSRL
jgi:phosphoheptose isomerase